MTRTRIALVTGALVAGVLFIQTAILSGYGVGFEVASAAVEDSQSDTNGLSNVQQLVPYLPGILVSDLFYAAAFGAGVFVALRFIRPIETAFAWKRVILRGLVAAAIGTAAVLVVRLLQTLLTHVSLGPYPLGYSFTPSFDPNNLSLGLLNAFGSVLNPFVYNAPLVLLACAFLKLWLGAHTAPVEPTETRAPASRAE